jgi:hypothetical protein
VPHILDCRRIPRLNAIRLLSLVKQDGEHWPLLPHNGGLLRCPRAPALLRPRHFQIIRRVTRHELRSENYLALQRTMGHRMNDRPACNLLIRYAMQCQICSRPVAERAPIYRLPSPYSSGRIEITCVCTGCVSVRPFKGRQWREPVPCDQCARPVISFRKVPRHVICGPEC